VAREGKGREGKGEAKDRITKKKRIKAGKASRQERNQERTGQKTKVVETTGHGKLHKTPPTFNNHRPRPTNIEVVCVVFPKQTRKPEYSLPHRGF